MDLITESPNDSCDQNITTDVIRQGALALGAPGIACLILNLVGLVAELLFVCRKKNNFLLRLFIYLSVAVTMSVGAYSTFIIMYILPQDGVFCEVTHTILQYSAAVELLFVFSTNLILLYKVYSNSHMPRTCGCPWNESRYSLEAVFVLLHFFIPAIGIGTFVGVNKKPGYCFTEQHSLHCYLQKKGLLTELVVFEMFPVLFDSLLSMVCISVLLVWLCWLRSKLLLKARMKTVLKEMGTWLAFLAIYCVVGIVIEISNFTDNPIVMVIAFISYPILHTTIPVLFFVYMCVSLCHGRKRNPREIKRAMPNSVGTTKLETAPPSSRVSLPSDTAEHAPNFLSPISEEEPSEVTPLINN